MQVHYLAREQMRAAIEDAWAVEENQSPNAGKIYSDHEAMKGRFPDSRLPLIQFLKDLFVPFCPSYACSGVRVLCPLATFFQPSGGFHRGTPSING